LRAKNEAVSILHQCFEVCNKPYLAFSGGKDSLALLILIAELGYQNECMIFTQGDDLDFSHKESYCRRVVASLGYEKHHYIMSEVSALEKLKEMQIYEELSGTFSHVVAKFVREQSPDAVIMGLRQEESKARRMTIGRYGQMFLAKKDNLHHCFPIGRWTGIDVFAQIVASGIEYIDVYDKDSPDRAPHEIRFSWAFSPAFAADAGSAFWLKKHYPEIFTRLAAINPQLRNYV